MLFDTHTHLDDEKFDTDRDELIESFKAEGVTLLVNIGADMKTSEASVKLAEKYDFIYATVGVHPNVTDDMTEENLARLKELASHEKVVAIGEIGLDYHYDEPDPEIQKEWFKKQLILAKELNLPYVVHDRDAHADVLEIIKSIGYTNGVMHCFSGSAEMAKEVTKMGMYVSIAGQVTFKNAPKVQAVAQTVPLDKLLIETDSPYLTPEPFRGKRNNSAYVRFTAEKIAELRGKTLEEIAKVTMENGKRFYNIK